MFDIDQTLFDTYGETMLKEMGHGFDEKRIETWLENFPGLPFNAKIFCTASSLKAFAPKP